MAELDGGNAVVLNISNLAGPLCTIDMEPGWKLHDLQLALHRKIGVPPSCQKLLANFMPLSDPGALLSDLLPESCVDLMLVRVEDPFVRLETPFEGVGSAILESDMMTVEEAKDKCTDLEDCQGFSFSKREHAAQRRITFYSKANFRLVSREHPFKCVTYVYLDVWEDRKLVLSLFETCRDILQFVMDRDIIKAAVEKNASSFMHVCSGLRADRDIVLKVVEGNGLCLQYASDILQNEEEIVRTALAQNPRALQYASEYLRADRQIVTLAVKDNASVLRFASDALRADRDIVADAVRQNGYALQYASAGLRGDREVVLAAVRQTGMALKYASFDLRKDDEVLSAALQQNSDARIYSTKGPK